MISKIIKENKAVLLSLGIIFLGLPLSLILSYFFAFKQRAYANISLCGHPVSGKNQKEILDLVNTLLENSPDKINLTANSQTFTLDGSFVEYNTQTTSRSILKIGREKDYLFSLKRIFDLYQNGIETQLSFEYDEKYLEEKIASLSAALNQPTVNPEIKVIKKNGLREILIEPGENGQEVNKVALRKSLLKEVTCPEKEITLEIPLIISSPKISENVMASTQKRAAFFLDKKIDLNLDRQNWEIKDEEIISFLSFTDSYNYQKITEYAGDFAQTLNSLPENATFQFENNQVLVFKPSKEGILLQEPLFVNEIVKNLELLESQGQSPQIQIPTIKTPADISTGDANTLGIKEIIGQGTSLFYGSISERIHNLQLASLKLNGILIAPDEIFSFNKALGDVSASTGFKQAYIIKNGRTVLGDGGGVCQVSTTLFRAALNAGLPIPERQAHAYRVHYYEDDLGPGFDATVFAPNTDLKIQNNTANYVLLQTNTDLKNKQLVFNLYGTKDGRIAEISKARVWDKQPPPPDLYQDDPTLPVGTVKQIDWKAWGAKAAFDYKVSKDNEVIFEKTFNSYYRPWQSIFLRGTGV